MRHCIDIIQKDLILDVENIPRNDARCTNLTEYMINREDVQEGEKHTEYLLSNQKPEIEQPALAAVLIASVTSILMNAL